MTRELTDDELAELLRLAEAGKKYRHNTAAILAAVAAIITAIGTAIAAIITALRPPR